MSFPTFIISGLLGKPQTAKASIFGFLLQYEDKVSFRYSSSQGTHPMDYSI